MVLATHARRARTGRPDTLMTQPMHGASLGFVPRDVMPWSLTTLREKLVKIGAKVTGHSNYVTFQLAEVAVLRNLFAADLDRIARLAIPPPVVPDCPAQEPEAAGRLGPWRKVGTVG